MIDISITVNNFYKNEERKKLTVNEVFLGIVKRNLSLDTSGTSVVPYFKDLPRHSDAASKKR